MIADKGELGLPDLGAAGEFRGIGEKPRDGALVCEQKCGGRTRGDRDQHRHDQAIECAAPGEAIDGAGASATGNSASEDFDRVMIGEADGGNSKARYRSSAACPTL